MNRTTELRDRASARWFVIACLLWLSGPVSTPCLAQDTVAPAEADAALRGDGAGRIVIETHGEPPKLPVYFTASAESVADVGRERVEQTIELALRVIQGEAEVVSVGLNGDGDVLDVEGDRIQSWAIRRRGDERFLDLKLTANTEAAQATVRTRSQPLTLPATISLTHLAPGDAVGFDSRLTVNQAPAVTATVTEASGFAPLESAAETAGFQSSTGGRIVLAINRRGAAAAPIELVNTTLTGELHPNGDSASFRLRATAVVTDTDAELALLAGAAAISKTPGEADYRVRLVTGEGNASYRIGFGRTGEHSVELEFVAPVKKPAAGWRRMDFTVAAGAVVPVNLNGLDAGLEFEASQGAVVPVREGDAWRGFLPATGRCQLQWRAAREANQGELFFTTTGLIEAQLGAGLLRQDHRIEYKVLQGELPSLSLLLRGPGDVLGVEGERVIGWEQSPAGEDRRLDITLSRPITADGAIRVRSQTPLTALPVVVEGLRLNPVGAIRHSGYLRLTNLGSVRLEPTNLLQLTQLAPDQYPGEAADSRQAFVYRFPAADHAFSVAADRIQPEVNVSQLVLYQLAETDRVIDASIELDIREAPIREWDFGIPADYSIVAVTGAGVSDYVAESQPEGETRNLKAIFANDLSGRQLIHLHLEKNIAAADGEWALPRIEHPDAKSIRGDVGVVGAPGYRVAIGETDLLVEQPLSYFPKSVPNLQQAFRIRQPDWSATMRIESLERSVQSDVLHLYSLSKGTVYGSALVNYFVTGAPVSEWRLTAPEALGNIVVDGQDVSTWRREGDELVVSLHQPVMGPYTLLVTFEQKPAEATGAFEAGVVGPIDVQGERGFIHVVSPMLVELKAQTATDDLLQLDSLELPAEFRLLSTATPLGTWQYTERPFSLSLQVQWFQPGQTATQVVEFSEATSRVSKDGELVTDVLYYVKSRGQRSLRLRLPKAPVRLWEVSVAGRPVTARQAEDATLIPLPGGADPNVPIEVRLRLGKPRVDESNPVLALPSVSAPVLKTVWDISGDPQRVLVPNGGTVEPPEPVLRPAGYEWVTRRGLLPLLLIGGLTGGAFAFRRRSHGYKLLGLAAAGTAVGVAFWLAGMAYIESGAPAPLRLSVPVLAPEEALQVSVRNTPVWRANLSWVGALALLVGVYGVLRALIRPSRFGAGLYRGVGALAIAVGVLLQRDSAPWFLGLLCLAIFLLVFLPLAFDVVRGLWDWLRTFTTRGGAKPDGGPSGPGAEAVAGALVLFALVAAQAGECCAAPPADIEAADSLTQQWRVTADANRLTASGTLVVSGRAGDRFLLLRAPAVLTRFDGEGLRLAKQPLPDGGLAYIVSIPLPEGAGAIDSAEEGEGDGADPSASTGLVSRTATFEYQLESLAVADGVPVLTGAAAVHEITLRYDRPGWEVLSANAMRVESLDSPDATAAKVILGPGEASLVLQPRTRDVSQETTRFFVEASNLYLPAPGVVDGRHRLSIRTSQGEVRELNVSVPEGLTVSEVRGPVGSWQFDAGSRRLKLQIEPAQSREFDIHIDTQRGLDPLPAEVRLAPLAVADAQGEVGLIAIAFGPDAQPEQVDAQGLSAVNLGDFDAGLIPSEQGVLHRVYRYGADRGELNLRVAPVDSEVRVVSQQVLSFGDERIVVGVNLVADITRAGLFRLSFPLPDGFEVESLTGAALHHWSELSAGGERTVVLHLNGKTIGPQKFSLTLTAAAPTDASEWRVPRLELNEATRQTGELVVQPSTGIRLRTVARQNVSEADPRAIGGAEQGSLAFRLLQRDWELTLGVEKLEPWVTGQVLHEVTLREGQTRSALNASFDVQNASIRRLLVELPIADEGEIKTLRATGAIVSDLVRTSPDSNVWEIRFKRRVVERIQFRIEYERRGDRAGGSETLRPVSFPAARQLAYYYAVRAGGRLEIEHGPLPRGWERVDWGALPPTLRESAGKGTPVFSLRLVAPTGSLRIDAERHALAEALKLRVTNGVLTTVLSPTGDQLTAADLTMEVIQRRSLTIQLPPGGELFNIFVNDESVHSVRQGQNANAWRFHVLPGVDDRTAKVRFAYALPGAGLRSLSVGSPRLDAPLENIEWNVIVPQGFVLTDDRGNLQLVRRSLEEEYDRDSYLTKISGQRNAKAQKAAALLETANRLLQAGEQKKANWALNSVANQYALDAASNEDARVQLKNLQAQQAIVGLNTRRQRFYLDNGGGDGAIAGEEQLLRAAAENPILQQDQLNFSPQQLSQLLQGNTNEDAAVLQRIATRLVQHQRTSEPAPQAITISIPEEGSIYTFARSVQVAENAPLELEIRLTRQEDLPPWRLAIALAATIALVVGLSFVGKAA